MMMSDNRMRDAARRLAGLPPLPEEKPKAAPTIREQLDGIEAGQRQIKKRWDSRDHLERTGGVAGAIRRLAGVEGDFDE